MKMVVSGELYDTEEAELCGTYIPYKAGLYRRTDDGTFFLATESRQSYRNVVDCATVKIRENNEYTIALLSDVNAQQWAGHNLAPETVNKIF